MYNEERYKNLVSHVYHYGKDVKSRNGSVRELFGTQLKLDVSDDTFPLITSRKMFYKGIIGEALAFLQTNCNHIDDFETRGCNYWRLWADEDGNLELDYPIHKQIYRIIKDIKEDPHSRRHIINLWNQDNLDHLSLPCCHYSYQFNVQGGKISMIWTQRSADLMVGVPSDMVLATIYLRLVAMKTGYEADTITMNFGSTHIYEEHLLQTQAYIRRGTHQPPKLFIADKEISELTQSDFTVVNYKHEDQIKFKLKA